MQGRRKVDSVSVPGFELRIEERKEKVERRENAMGHGGHGNHDHESWPIKVKSCPDGVIDGEVDSNSLEYLPNSSTLMAYHKYKSSVSFSWELKDVG